MMTMIMMMMMMMEWKPKEGIVCIELTHNGLLVSDSFGWLENENLAVLSPAPTANCRNLHWHTSTNIPCPLGQQVSLEGALLMLHSFPRFHVSPINRSIERKARVTSSAPFPI